MVGILSPDLPAILSIKKLAGHSDIKTTQCYYLSVQEDDLEKARQVQSEIPGGVLTDLLLTHFGLLLGSRPEPMESSVAFLQRVKFARPEGVEPLTLGSEGRKAARKPCRPKH